MKIKKSLLWLDRLLKLNFSLFWQKGIINITNKKQTQCKKSYKI